MAARVPTTSSALLGRRPAMPSQRTCQSACNLIRTATQFSRCSTGSPGSRRAFSQTPTPAADIIRRPRRPYQFTQLVQLSDGSTYTMRTSSPLAMYKSTKDTRNHLTWQPSDKSLKSVEVDEAGKLAAFRGRFGRGFDLEAESEEGQDSATAAGDSSNKSARQASSGDALGDLIAGYVRAEETNEKAPEKGKPAPAPAGGKKK